MNCRDVRKWMSPYLDSELGQTKTFEVSEHLRDCPDCAARFEAERGVDEQVRERLGVAGDGMPADLWDRFRSDLATPAWLRRLRDARVQLALAACLAVVLIGAAWFWRPVQQDARPWIVAQLAVEAPQNRPFVGMPAEREAARALLHDGFNIQLTAEPTIVGPQLHAGIRLVRAIRRADSHRREFLEVHLNCCGEPVMIVLARPDSGTLPEPFDVVPPGAENFASQTDGVQLASIRTPTFVALVASPHPVGEIVERLSAAAV